MTDNEIMLNLAYAKARRDFGIFRRLINNNLLCNWFVDEINEALQQFYIDFKAGLRPKLMINCPPQHGKSSAIIDFIAWAIGKDPAMRAIFASYSEDLGIRGNRALQRIIDSDIYQNIFKVELNKKNTVTVRGSALRNSTMIEFKSCGGYFHNTTVGGSITGKSADISVIDDPVKSRKEANSLLIRNNTWDWYNSDFLSRFSKDYAILIIMTRWHVDDLAGRLRSYDKSLKVLSYEAIAKKDEAHRKAGEALHEQLKPLSFLLEIKKTMDTMTWESLYQQNPIIVGGEIIKREWFKSYSMLPPIDYVCIFADTAQKTAEHNDYSVLQAWGYSNGQIYLIDQVRGKFEAPELKRTAIAFWQKHKSSHIPCRAFYIEDKSSGTGLIQEIKREGSVPVIAVQRTKDKLTRVQDVLSYIEAGYLHLPNNAPFLSDYLAEMEEFSGDNGHRHDDQIDPTIDAINVMLAKQNNSIFTREMFE